MRSAAKIRLKEDDLKSEVEPIWCAIDEVREESIYFEEPIEDTVEE